uniref:hypothetical protein n=1 Tax=Campylobacter concisus TaxID=199 RepID=UPI001CA362A3
ISYENLSNTSYNKGSSLSIGANYQVGKKDDSKAKENIFQIVEVSYQVAYLKIQKYKKLLKKHWTTQIKLRI